MGFLLQGQLRRLQDAKTPKGQADEDELTMMLFDLRTWQVLRIAPLRAQWCPK